MTVGHDPVLISLSSRILMIHIDAAIYAFQQIVIELQSTIIEHMSSAQENDDINDFKRVLDVSNSARMRSVRVLYEMQQNMVMFQASQLLPMIEFGESQQMLSPGLRNEPRLSPPINGYGWNTQPQRSITEISASTWMSNSQPPRRSTTGVTAGSSEPQILPGMNPMVGRMALPGPMQDSNGTSNRSKDKSEENIDTAGSQATLKRGLRQLFESPRPHNHPVPREEPKTHTVSFLQPASTHDSPDQRSLVTSNSSASLSRPSSDSTSSPPLTTQPLRKKMEAVKKKIPMNESPHAASRKRINNDPKPRTPRTASQSVVASAAAKDSLATTSGKSRKSPFPFFGHSDAPKADFAGFCQGASLMQSGNHGMKFRNDSIAFTGQSNYWGCGNKMCSFQGPAVQGRDQNRQVIWGFDDDIREMYGVRYRWSFLAKSHTEIGNSKRKGLEYQCTFCHGQGLPCTKVRGESAFIKHVSTHQGQRPDPFKMFLFIHIVGRKAQDGEIFDVNLTKPLNDKVNSGMGKETEPGGLGIQLDDRRNKTHSMDFGVMRRAEDDSDWHVQSQISELAATEPAHDNLAKGLNDRDPTVIQSISDLHPAHPFSADRLYPYPNDLNRHPSLPYRSAASPTDPALTYRPMYHETGLEADPRSTNDPSHQGRNETRISNGAYLPFPTPASDSVSKSNPNSPPFTLPHPHLDDCYDSSYTYYFPPTETEIHPALRPTSTSIPTHMSSTNPWRTSFVPSLASRDDSRSTNRMNTPPDSGVGMDR